MSVKVMSIVWEASDLSPTDRLVLLSLADHANDEGKCYPSVKRLADRTGLSTRAAQTAVRRLQGAGWLSVEQNAGPKGCNIFTITPPQEMHPAAAAPPQEMQPPPQEMRPTPAAAAPEPSGTIREPSIVSPNGEVCAPSASDISEAVTAYNATALRTGWPECRALSDRRRKSLKARLRDLGGLPGWDEALAKAEASDFICGRLDRAWNGFGFDDLLSPAKITKLMEGKYDNRTRNPNTGRSPGSGTAAAFATVALERSHGRH